MLALPHGLEVQPENDLREVEFGVWQGLSFDELTQIPDWKRFNEVRSRVRIPGGESMLETQLRVMRCVDSVLARTTSGTVLLVTHADVIRAALSHLGGIALDLAGRFEISPASVTAVSADSAGPRILFVNRQEGFTL